MTLYLLLLSTAILDGHKRWTYSYCTADIIDLFILICGKNDF